ncbi:MAG: secretin N-terminal domain-containing protein [Sphingomicrobium sp.]
MHKFGPAVVRHLFLCLSLLAMTVAAPALAQVPAVVEEIKLVTADDSRASFIIRFSPAEPQYAAVNANPTRPEVMMRGTLLAPRVGQRAPWRGIVRSTNFASSDSGLTLYFETAAPAKATVEPAGDKSIQITITKLTEAEALGSRPLGSSGETVVPATDLPTYVDYNPGDSYELVPLKYADVSEIIGLLTQGETIQPNNIFIRREPGFGSLATTSQPNYVSAQSQAQQQQLPLGQSFGNGLAIDRRLNAIWITGSPDRIARVKQQIGLIDIPVDSVILETQFVELTENGARNLGVDFANSSGQIAVGTINTGSNLPFGLDPNRILPSGQLQAAIYAQVQRGEGRIVSRPRIAAQSGSTAKIITGDAIPILTNITLSGVNGVSQQVQYVNVGVTLQIAPRVSSDGFVTSQIYGVVSSVTGTSQGYPTISQREAETSASVRDGETFVIGGLTQDNVLSTKSKVPILGDIPLAGQLFRVERSTRSKTELYIVITPHIVRHRRFETGTPPPLPDAIPAPLPAPTINLPLGNPLAPSGSPRR